MTENKINIYKKVFLLGAVYNISMGVFGLIFYKFAVQLLLVEQGMKVSETILGMMFIKIFFAVVVIFGAGYYFVSRDLTLNRGIIWLGLISKIILFMIVSINYFTGTIYILFLLAVIGDFFWAIIFMKFLYDSKDTVKVNNIIG